ncbi:cation diffusion facilitator family transporter [Devriesea agamarum]|uniref:cation diffusion facilitator family transporter n=1 Tax=Devriesea agamarum TaxID=472569 RepID=UPI000A061FBD|nr:cation diffusion facilitator family transporter [Devriesea agamarum]
MPTASPAEPSHSDTPTCNSEQLRGAHSPHRSSNHGHTHTHTHSHSHSHSHSGSPRRLILVAVLTASVFVVEVIGALLTGSLALLTDAGHMMTDVIGLGIAAMAAHLATRPADDRRTWGFLRAEVLGAGIQATILLGVGIYAVIEGIQRLFSPEPITSWGLLIFGIIGLTVNIVAVFLLSTSKDSSLNLRAAFLEVVADALGSVAVIVAALVMALTGWEQADAVAGLIIAALIIPRALSILRESASVLMESTPAGIDVEELRHHLLERPRVLAVHDLHVSRISTNLPVLSGHVTVEDECFYDGSIPALLDELQACLAGHFDVEHSTFQIEPARHRGHENLGHS